MQQPVGVAVVTGTSSGIGEAVAVELLRRQWQVVGVSRRPAVIKHSGYTHVGVDLANVDELADRMDVALGPRVAHPSITRLGLVNNAGDPGLLGPLDRVDPVEMLRVYAVNVVAAAWLMGWIVRRSPKDAVIRIVNVSSGAAVTPCPGLGTYGSSKAALRMAGMVFASELDSRDRMDERRNATILSYEPGTVDTAMQTAVRASTVETLPIVHIFKKLAADGALVPASGPAADIAAYLDSDGHARFTERRYGA
jgi:benzil reductase ((S)-benzoin forming)